MEGSEETGPVTAQQAEPQPLEDEKAQDKGNYYVIIKDLVMRFHKITLNFSCRRIQINLVPRLFPLFEERPWSGLVT
jgi:hypothetical protein